MCSKINGEELYYVRRYLDIRRGARLEKKEECQGGSNASLQLSLDELQELSYIISSVK
jgi:hypothetical protein